LVDGEPREERDRFELVSIHGPDASALPVALR
jgi:hypothetical protein